MRLYIKQLKQVLFNATNTQIFAIFLSFISLVRTPFEMCFQFGVPAKRTLTIIIHFSFQFVDCFFNKMKKLI